MHVIVLGAGVVGTASAWYLRKAGHDVTVIDRRPGAGLETSFANAGQISVSHAEPWANPGAPGQILKWLGREDAPLLFRARADLRQWEWGARFLLECLPGRTRRNTLEILDLAMYSRAQLQELRRETGVEYDHLERGIMHLYTDAHAFRGAAAQVELMRSRGCEMELKNRDECMALEPALRFSRIEIAGATYARADETGDAHLFTRNLAELCRARGVAFRYGAEITAVRASRDQVSGVELRGADGRIEDVRGDAYVASLGSFTPIVLAPLRLDIPVYPVKGYSITMPVKNPERAPMISCTDESGKMGVTRLGNRIRAAGTAELTGYDASVTPARCDALVARARQFYPDACDYDRAERWAGLRPATPGNVPLLGATRYSNLFLNTGHGTLGWTMACGSGRVIADVVSRRTPEVATRRA